MGYELERFIGNVDELLICLICHGVLQHPMQCTICEQAFCQECLCSWMSNNSMCPANRHNMLLDHVDCVPRVLTKLLDRLKIKCAFVGNGCQAQLALENLRAHEASCEKNPNTMVTCNEGCGLLLPRGELEQHSCLSKLRALMEAQEKIIGIHKNELENLHHFIHCLRRTFPAIGNIGQNWDRFSLAEWGLTLPLAIVRNWGKVMFRLNCAMMSDLKDSLRNQGCPMQVIDELVHNSRHFNASGCLREYRFRLLQPLSSGEQCVLILGDENDHMPVNLMRGGVMVFEDGVERAVDNAVTNEENDESDGSDTDSGDIDGDNDSVWGPAIPQMMSLPLDAYHEQDYGVSDPRVANNYIGTWQDTSFHAGFVTSPQVGNNQNCFPTTVTPINNLVTANDRTWGAPISIPPMMNLPIDAYRDRGFQVSDPRVANNSFGTWQDTIFNAGFVPIPEVGIDGNAAWTTVTPINNLVTNNGRVGDL